jgi:hypothetical protein
LQPHGEAFGVPTDDMRLTHVHALCGGIGDHDGAEPRLNGLGEGDCHLVGRLDGCAFHGRLGAPEAGVGECRACCSKQDGHGNDKRRRYAHGGSAAA